MTGYVICATPRSGSTLLCALLRSSGVAGHPESWFRAESRVHYARNWGILRADGGFDWAQYLRAARVAGRAGGAVLGLRLMWPTMAELASMGLIPALGPLRFIHLERSDGVAQAVSRLKAEVSGTWHLGFEAADHPVAPQYDFARIKGFGEEAATDNASWRDHFRHHQITPLHLTYEALAEDPTGVAKQAMRFLGLQPDAPLTAANRRMADAVSAEWAQRFRAEAAADGC